MLVHTKCGAWNGRLAPSFVGTIEMTDTFFSESIDAIVNGAGSLPYSDKVGTSTLLRSLVELMKNYKHMDELLDKASEVEINLLAYDILKWGLTGTRPPYNLPVHVVWRAAGVVCWDINVNIVDGPWSLPNWVGAKPCGGANVHMWKMSFLPLNLTSITWRNIVAPLVANVDLNAGSYATIKNDTPYTINVSMTIWRGGCPRGTKSATLSPGQSATVTDTASSCNDKPGGVHIVLYANEKKTLKDLLEDLLGAT